MNLRARGGGNDKEGYQLFDQSNMSDNSGSGCILQQIVLHLLQESGIVRLKREKKTRTEGCNFGQV